MSLETAMQHYDMRKEIRSRAAREEPVVPGIGLYKCIDGHIFSYVIAGFGAGWDAIVDWMDSENMAGDLKDSKWNEIWELITDFRKLVSLVSDTKTLMAKLEQFAHISQLLKAFLMRKTKAQIYDEASERRIMMAPVQNSKDLVENAQLNALGFFKEVDHPELGMKIKYPGAPYYHISDTPWRISRRAPLVGEHNFEVYEKEMGMTRNQIILMKNQGTI
jgi:crotonobetainyl-CoA:carnitine CoA-transferase CaiB-like acyl-CoA transferase